MPTYSASSSGGSSSGSGSSLAPHPGGGRYFSVPNAASTRTTRDILNGRIWVVPGEVGTSVTLDRIAIDVTTAGEVGSVVRMGVYEDADGYPGALLEDAGTLAADTTGSKEFTISVARNAQRFWVAALAQDAGTTSPIVRAFDHNAAGVTHTSLTFDDLSALLTLANYTGSATGLPDPFPADIGYAQSAPHIMARAT